MNANRILVSVFALLSAASISFGSSAYGAPVIIKGAPAETILQNSSTVIVLIPGNNPLDALARFNCKSTKGCVVLMTISLDGEQNFSGWGTCPYVDGVSQGNPSCDPGFSTGQSLLHMQLNVGNGSHTVQTIIDEAGAGGDEITSWETDYTVYEIK